MIRMRGHVRRRTYEQWALLEHVSLSVPLELVFDLPPNSPQDNDLRSHRHDRHNQVLASARLYLLWRLLLGNHEQSGRAMKWANQRLEDNRTKI